MYLKLSRLIYHYRSIQTIDQLAFQKLNAMKSIYLKKICTLNTADCYFFLFVVKIRLIPKWGIGRVGDRGGRAQFSFITKLNIYCRSIIVIRAQHLLSHLVRFCLPETYFLLLFVCLLDNFRVMFFNFPFFLSRQYVTVVVGGDENQSHKIS